MIRAHRWPIALAALGLMVAGCRDTGTEPADLPTGGEVFLDEYADNVTFQAFAGSKLDAVQIDATEAYEGTASLRITVPAEGAESGTYAGGAFTVTIPRDLSEFDALTFYVKASTAASLDVAGMGNDNTETTPFVAERTAISVGTSWTRVVIPIPLASKLDNEDGLFFFAEGPEGGAGNTFWFDEIQFETLGTVTNARPAMADVSVSLEVGATTQVSDTEVTYAVAGTDITVSAAPSYFTFTSSDAAVATVDAAGVITMVADGTATITAELGETAADGSVTVDAVAPPAAAAPTPTEDAADVISLFSDAYTDVTVDTWSASWDDANVEDVEIDGNAAKRYFDLVFAGIEFTSSLVDASAMTHFHMDIWTPDETADPVSFKVKLVDFGADAAFGGGDDVESEISFTASTTPALATGSWVSIDVPLSDFAGLVTTEALAQMVLSSDLGTVYVDNVYFYAGQVIAPSAPSAAAPTPAQDAADVISLFSDPYTDVPVDTWSPDWDQATVADTDVAGNATKLYTGLTYAVIDFASNTIDGSSMTHFHMDIWTPDPSADPAAFKVKLVDFGADGVWSNGGDDVESELAFTASTTPALVTGSWVSIDVPLADFTGLTTKGALAQIVISGDPNTVYMDNVYFYAGQVAAPSEPSEAAPTPTEADADVISLYSDAYSDVAVATWSPDWDGADLADVTVAGNATKLYTNLSYAVVDFGSTYDASGMTHFRMDIWTPDATADPASFKVKLVDFGADGAYQGNDDVEHELTFTAATTPALATGSWVTLDIPLADFTGLTTREHMAQIVISGDPNTVYVDNVYFHK